MFAKCFFLIFDSGRVAHNGPLQQYNDRDLFPFCIFTHCNTRIQIKGANISLICNPNRLIIILICICLRKTLSLHSHVLEDIFCNGSSRYLIIPSYIVITLTLDELQNYPNAMFFLMVLLSLISLNLCRKWTRVVVKVGLVPFLFFF